jgi:tRNA/rRNA methyltransferase
VHGGRAANDGVGYHETVDRVHLDLEKIRIVLTEPLYGGNIGQVARAMVNFGLSRLALVNPREHLTPEAYWMAREGKGILDGAGLYPTLEAALEGVGLAVATTRRGGKYRRPAMTPRTFAAELAPLTRENDVAIVFGREDSGLSGAELGLCQWIVTIPASESFPSLNLAQAVLLVGYELFLESLEGRLAADEERLKLASVGELERLHEHLHETLGAIGFLHGDQAPAILTSLRRILGRARLESRDVKILRGILGQMDWYRKRALGEVPAPDGAERQQALRPDAAAAIKHET